MRHQSTPALFATVSIAVSSLCSAQDTAAPGPQASRMLDSFAAEDGGAQLEWFTVLDGVMGGRSSGRFLVDDGVLRFRGVLNTNGGGFSSIRSRTQPFQLDGFVGLHLRVRGDGRRYSMRLEQSGERARPRASYRGEFGTLDMGVGRNDGAQGANTNTWQDVYLPFDGFVPTWRGRILRRPDIDPARIQLLGLTMADGIDGPFAIEVESIQAYRPFDLVSLRGERRALLVFGPQAADMDVLRQLIDLNNNREGCGARDLSVVVVLEEGPSRIGGRPLASIEGNALRAQFEAPAGRFTAVLIGKDGTEKARSERMVSAAEWFQRIDAMPMRRAEMRAEGSTR